MNCPNLILNWFDLGLFIVFHLFCFFVWFSFFLICLISCKYFMSIESEEKMIWSPQIAHVHHFKWLFLNKFTVQTPSMPAPHVYPASKWAMKWYFKAISTNDLEKKSIFNQNWRIFFQHHSSIAPISFHCWLSIHITCHQHTIFNNNFF